MHEGHEVEGVGVAHVRERVRHGRPRRAVKERRDASRARRRVVVLGGTGRTHDWSISRAIVEAVHVPVFLAGGLRRLADIDGDTDHFCVLLLDEPSDRHRGVQSSAVCQHHSLCHLYLLFCVVRELVRRGRGRTSMPAISAS